MSLLGRVTDWNQGYLCQYKTKTVCLKNTFLKDLIYRGRVNMHSQKYIKHFKDKQTKITLITVCIKLWLMLKEDPA